VKIDVEKASQYKLIASASANQTYKAQLTYLANNGYADLTDAQKASAYIQKGSGTVYAKSFGALFVALSVSSGNMYAQTYNLTGLTSYAGNIDSLSEQTNSTNNQTLSLYALES